MYLVLFFECCDLLLQHSFLLTIMEVTMFYQLTIETILDSHLEHPTSSISKQNFVNIKELVSTLLDTILNKDELTHIEYDIGICLGVYCKDCFTTNEKDFKDSITDTWCDDCFDKSYDEWVKQDKKRNA